MPKHARTRSPPSEEGRNNKIKIRECRLKKDRSGSGSRDDDERPPQLPDLRVLQPLASSGHLSSVDLGRLLLLTSKGITEAFTSSRGESNEQEHESGGAREGWDSSVLWKSLCANHFGKENADALIQSSGMSPEQCFRSFAHHPKPRASVPPLKYAPSDYMVTVEIRTEEGKLLLFKVLDGEDIPDFFEKGEHEVSLDQPIVGYEDLESPSTAQLRFRTKVHIMRRPDNLVV